MTKNKCPYCADPDLLDKILNPPAGTLYSAHPGASMSRRGSHWPKPPKVKINVKRRRGVRSHRWGAVDPRLVVRLKTPEIRYGKYHIKTITDADMTERYAGFKVEIIGVESRTEKPIPSGAFFSRVRDEKNGKPFFVSFEAARITYKDSPVIIDVHWSPDHGRIVTVRGFSKTITTPEEMAILSTALRFDIKQLHGAPPKIDPKELERAIRTQGARATQKSVSDVIGAAPRTLRDWLYFQVGTTWEDFKEETLATKPAKRASGE
jgi:hypothetical protein